MLSLPVLLVLCVLVHTASSASPTCQGGSWEIVETIPSDLGLPTVGNSTYNGFMRALSTAQNRVAIAALWTALNAPSDKAGEPDAWRGAALNQTLVKLASHGVDVSVVTNDCTVPGHIFPCGGALWWQEHGGVNVTLADWSKLLGAGWGVQHAKVLAVDGQHAYSGSANMAWSSFAQTKELGIMFYDCPVLADIYDRLVSMWVLAGRAGRVPDVWPDDLLPQYNAENPVRVELAPAAREGAAPESLTIAPCYSPPPLNYGPVGDDCKDTLVSLITEASTMINIQLMDYSPTSLYQNKGGHPELYWDVLDRALRQAAFRGVEVNLLVSNWTMTFALEQPYWRSLDQARVNIRQFIMPATKGYAAMGRVNHCKFMVTDDAAQIMTSNWSYDYYELFGGVGMTVRGGSVRKDLLRAFQRDWESPYAVPLVYSP